MKNTKLFKLIALILCTAMLFGMLTACKKDEEPEEVEDPGEEVEEVNDFDKIYESIDANTPVLNIGGIDITWGVLYYHFYEKATYMYHNYTILDWTADYYDGVSYLDECINLAIYDYLSIYAATDHYAAEYNVTLSDEQKAAIEEDKAYDLDLFDGDQYALDDYMNSMYLSQETVDYIAMEEVLYQNVMDAMMGENGETMPEDKAMEMAETAYQMVKVVPFATTGADKEAQLAAANEALSELKVTNKVNYSVKFDELIDKYADPEKAEELKKGYVYTRGNYNTDIEKIVSDLAEGNFYNGVVETEDGYYLVLRMPIDLDAYPYYKGEYGESTLRFLYKDDVFQEIIYDWADNAEVVYYDALKNMNIDEILGYMYVEE